MLITIFTPTYNRINTLPWLYESLCRQTFTDFEWLVVDDGSTDDTEQLIKKYIDDGLINISYHRQVNGGKHRAVNKGVELAVGYLFMIVDSDDLLSNNSVLEFVSSKEKVIRGNSRFCAIVGNRINENRDVIGSIVSHNSLLTNFIEYREKYAVKGDRAEVVKTEVMREYRLPEFENESFCPEGIIWNRIAKKYQAVYFNVDFVICEYLTDGLTASIKKCRQSNQNAFLTYYSEYCALANARLRNKIKRSILYWAVSFKTRSNIGRGYMLKHYFCTYPLGLIAHLLNKI